jgi:glycosyltransferase involved in cell wall biosynthesis
MIYMLKVGIFVTHPVQYHVPLWRGLFEARGLEVKVFYFSDQGVAGKIDPGFGQAVTWDVPLLEGYAHEFLQKDAIETVSRSSIPDVVGVLTRERFDVVLLNGYMHRFARQLVLLKFRFGFRVVLRGEFTDVTESPRAWWKQIFRENYLRWFYRRVDRFCPIGSEAVKHLMKRGISESRMLLTRYAVDDTLIERQKVKFPRASAREDLGLTKETILFLFSGKLIPRKQPLLLAEAAAALAENKRFALCYLGSGEQLSMVEALLRPLLGERLLMPGFVNQNELGLYFAAADVFVLPSAYDTWGLVVNEAMHWGLPCVVSDKTGCHRDLVQPGATGFIHAWDSAEELKTHLQRFLDEPDLASRLGRCALEQIEPYRIARTTADLISAVRDAYAVAAA